MSKDNELETLFIRLTGEPPLYVKALSAAGSNRKYFRLTGPDRSFIGVEGTSIEENRAFIVLSKHFKQAGLPVPQVFEESCDGLFYLQEDLGDTLLFDFISHGRETGTFNKQETDMLHEVMQKLPEIQVLGAKDLDFSVCYPQPAFNRRSVMWDLNYFKYCFLKATGIEFLEDRLEDDFNRLSDTLLQSESNTFMYRDFQSRNIMIKDGKPCFIDFQGGRKGPVHYDVASFLWQAKARYPQTLRKELLHTYLRSLNRFMPVNDEEFGRQLRHFVLFRTLQVLGAYGFRGYFEKKAHFLQSIPFALENLRELLADDFVEYPYLTTLLKQMIGLKQFQTTGPNPCPNPAAAQGLTVTVCSFSYKKGIPNDESGNGGGFVFDCRAIHNPGKYERYKSLTGQDLPVIEFLEEDGEIKQFLKHAWSLVDAAVKRYKERGFTSLMVCFGCTGGQHRSVYSAQKTAEHLFRQHDVEVHLIHREQNKEQRFVPSKTTSV